MFAHQKLDQIQVFGIEPMLTAETSDLLCPQIGVVAASALGNVVEQGGDI